MIFNKIINFLKEVRLEMKKINWPMKEEVLKDTLIVIGISVTVAALLGSLDFIFLSLLKKFIL